MGNGVSARCRQMMGACHGLELLLPAVCSDIARATAGDIVDLAITSGDIKQKANDGQLGSASVGFEPSGPPTQRQGHILLDEGAALIARGGGAVGTLFLSGDREGASIYGFAASRS